MKQKTNKSVAKRAKVTKGGKKGGKVLFRKSAGNHLLSSKNPRQVKLAGGDVQAPKGHMKTISRLLCRSK